MCVCLCVGERNICERDIFVCVKEACVCVSV